MILPDDGGIAWRNLLGTGAVVVVCGGFATALYAVGMLSFYTACFTAAAFLFIIVVLLLRKHCPDMNEIPRFQTWYLKCLYIASAVVVLGFVLHGIHGGSATGATPAPTASAKVTTHMSSATRTACLSRLSAGQWRNYTCDGYRSQTRRLTDVPVHWYQEQDDHRALAAVSHPSYCHVQAWEWDAATAADCHFQHVDVGVAGVLAHDRSFVFVGDSLIRNVYHQFIATLEPSYIPPHYQGGKDAEAKHQNLHYTVATSQTRVSFYWAPTLTELGSWLETTGSSLEPMHALVTGVALWDALTEKNDLSKFETTLETLKISNVKANVLMWMIPTTIVDSRLNTQAKSQFMTEQIVSHYRDAVKRSPLINKSVDVVLDPSMTISVHSHQPGATDGVHYSDEVYAVIAQLFWNAYRLKTNTLSVPNVIATHATPQPNKPYKPKPTGSMSFPWRGFGVLVTAAVMLVTFDSFFGCFWLMNKILGIPMPSWKDVYGPLHQSLGLNVIENDPIVEAATAPNNSSVLVELPAVETTYRQEAAILSSKDTDEEERRELLGEGNV